MEERGGAEDIQKFVDNNREKFSGVRIGEIPASSAGFEETLQFRVSAKCRMFSAGAASPGGVSEEIDLRDRRYAERIRQIDQFFHFGAPDVTIRETQLRMVFARIDVPQSNHRIIEFEKAARTSSSSISKYGVSGNQQK